MYTVSFCGWTSPYKHEIAAYYILRLNFLQIAKYCTQDQNALWFRLLHAAVRFYRHNGSSEKISSLKLSLTLPVRYFWRVSCRGNTAQRLMLAINLPKSPVSPHHSTNHQINESYGLASFSRSGHTRHTAYERLFRFGSGSFVILILRVVCSRRKLIFFLN